MMQNLWYVQIWGDDGNRKYQEHFQSRKDALAWARNTVKAKVTWARIIGPNPVYECHPLLGKKIVRAY